MQHIDKVGFFFSLKSCTAAAMIAFDDRKHFFTSRSPLAERWIEANDVIMQLSGRLQFALPWHQLVATPTWKRLMEAEEFLTRYGPVMHSHEQ